MSLLRFTIFYVLYCCIIAAVSTAIPMVFSDPSLLIAKFWVVFFFLAGLTYIAYVTAYLGMERNPEVGVMAIMGSITLKMLLSLAFVLIYSQKQHEMGLIFLTNFFSLYLSFSFFEIYCLLRNLRHQNK